MSATAGKNWPISARPAPKTAALIFADLHYLLALTGDNRSEATANMLQRIQKDAQRNQGDTPIRMSDPGIAAAKGLEAFGDGLYGQAFDFLSNARGGHATGGWQPRPT